MKILQHIITTTMEIGSATLIKLPDDRQYDGLIEFEQVGPNQKKKKTDKLTELQNKDRYCSSTELIIMSDLVPDSGLVEYSLQFQKTIKMLCCLEYSILLTSQTGLKHIHNCHAKTYKKYPKKI